ncbi:hypothetical protein [Phycisphaera mikurensis]|uniref:Uncharacterized protein n=1 Tax=Phycisphaera mikurensis (strain NBRC 102666 / KCTC 22515 / FYK2301M01) TaxID=1142394 RepID=I0IEB3_PHYMF|nr:hypothetical protein [Phycisphaera mikurensis]MBB6441402.1 hypothetical protein [Phycisphaera mikurensis]BAM03601.1 hypothetical protein PSMK_14420 [Phycisphaera mikurensis NBRC 102666]
MKPRPAWADPVCPRCGYNRRGTAWRSACPECGDARRLQPPPPPLAKACETLGIASLMLGCPTLGLTAPVFGLPTLWIGGLCLLRCRDGIYPPSTRRPVWIGMAAAGTALLLFGLVYLPIGLHALR